MVAPAARRCSSYGSQLLFEAVRETLKEFPMLDARGVAEVVAVALHFSEKVDSNAMLVANLATATALSKEVRGPAQRAN